MNRHRRTLPFVSLLTLACIAGCAADHASVDEASDSEHAPLASAVSVAVDWNPGHYMILGNNTPALRDQALHSSQMVPFTGIQLKYDWFSFEGAMGDYSAGFAQLDDDLRATAAANKKLLAMIQYKQFGSTPHAVPAYMLAAGPWCIGTGAAKHCGEYTMANGVTALIWQGAGHGGVAERLHAWFAALGAHVASSPYKRAFAGIVLPETALSAGSVPLADVGYTQPAYLGAIEANLTSLLGAFPTSPIFQYINFFPPNNTAPTYLQQLADFALAHPRIGLGCPDVSPMISPPGYAILKSATYQTRVPFNVAVESPDFAADRTTGFLPTYDLAVDPAPNGMRAQYVSWYAKGGNGGTDVFSIDDVASYITTHKIPNTRRPTW